MKTLIAFILALSLFVACKKEDSEKAQSQSIVTAGSLSGTTWYESRNNFYYHLTEDSIFQTEVSTNRDTSCLVFHYQQTGDSIYYHIYWDLSKPIDSNSYTRTDISDFSMFDSMAKFIISNDSLYVYPQGSSYPQSWGKKISL